MASVPPSERPTPDDRPPGDPAQEERVAACASVADLLGSYAAKELPDEEHARVKRHLSSCSKCAREAAEYRRLIRIAHSLPPLDPPPDVEERLLRALARAVRDKKDDRTGESAALDETKTELPRLPPSA